MASSTGSSSQTLVKHPSEIVLPKAQELELADFKLLCTQYIGQCNEKLIEDAYKLCFVAHKDVVRVSGEPYYLHPLAVATIVVKDIATDDVSVAAALLHDVIEDTDYTLRNIVDWFGEDVGVIVDGVTKISDVFKDKNTKQAETFMKLLLTMSNDLRVVLIKFADRLHNMRTIHHVKREKQLKTASETKLLYAPLAHRLGLFKIKSELEDLCFKVEDPNTYKFIARKLKEKKESREEFINDFMAPIKEKLVNQGFKFQIKGRPKHLFSIYKKMVNQQKPFEDIYDLFAIRIILDNQHGVDDCWRVYSIFSNMYTPIPDRLRDFISKPKSNGYRSLHTTVMTPRGRRVEIQIRTLAMDEVAERGLAAHWKYKEGTNSTTEVDKISNWLRDIIEKTDADDVPQFVQDFQLNLQTDEIYVFTPKGETITLPIGATPLDFAFEIHTAVGEKAKAAKVNGKMTPLRQKLVMGDQVEIITAKNINMSIDWLDHVVTHKALSRIRQYVKKQERKIRAEGRELLLRRIKDFDEHTEQKELMAFAHFLGYQNLESLYTDLGADHLDIRKVIVEHEKYVRKKEDLSATLPEALDNTKIEEQFLQAARDIATTQGALVIDGLHSDLKYSYAKCCHPIPGDDAIGFVSKTGEVKIHRTNCKNMQHLLKTAEERVVDVTWVNSISYKFLGGIKFVGEDRVGLINDVTETVSKFLKTNIQALNISSDSGMFEGVISIYVRDLTHLDQIINKLSRINGMKYVYRYE